MVVVRRAAAQESFHAQGCDMVSAAVSRPNTCVELDRLKVVLTQLLELCKSASVNFYTVTGLVHLV